MCDKKTGYLDTITELIDFLTFYEIVYLSNTLEMRMSEMIEKMEDEAKIIEKNGI